VVNSFLINENFAKNIMHSLHLEQVSDSKERNMHRGHTGLWNVQLHHDVTGFARPDTRKFKAKKLRRLLNKSIELKLPIFKHTPVRGETVPLEHKHSDILLALSVIAHNTALKLASLISHRLLKHKLGLSFRYRSHA